jgi:carboxypeptidase Q
VSANVIGEVRGRDLANEIVLLGAHLDSWDVGDGAIDDGAGVGIVLEAAHLAVALKPRRTIRVVLFMNEEYGLSGATAYAAAHQAELSHHVAAMEADAGAGAPTGFGVSGGETARAMLARMIPPLAALTGSDIRISEQAGADISALHDVGVPEVSVRQDVSDYFEWHHTDGDTADKIDPDAISRTAAAFAVLAADLAEMEEKLPRGLAK